ncbi:MAG TPA: TIR domain-containing protein [Ktedonobacteraceae bacterium]|jgi:WD40 repeat protein
MASAFISYSRQDEQIALALQDALKAHGRSTWIDQRGIEPTEQWRQSIYQAIDKAEAFLYLLSPDALTSNFCTEELRYALANKKRIIPIVVHAVHARDVLKAVADIQWIFCQQERMLKQAVDEILTALDIDHPHRHLGAHLLVRARRWENSGHKHGLLLSGSERKEAEQWLAESANKPQGATELHIRFFNASQHKANRRRWLLTGVSVLLTLLFGSLSLFSYAQMQVATQQRNLAVDRFASLLAANAERALPQMNDPEQGLLLASAANHISDTLTTRTSVYDALEHSPRLLKILTGHFDNYGIIGSGGRGIDSANRGISDLFFAPDSPALISAGEGDGTIRIWDPSTGKQRVFALPRYRHPDGISHLAVSPDGRWLATQSVYGVWIWDAKTGQQVAAIRDGGFLVAFSPDGRLVTVDCLAGFSCDLLGAKITFWDTMTWMPTLSLVQNRSLGTLAFSPAGGLLATSGCAQARTMQTPCPQSFIQLWNTHTGAPIGGSTLVPPGVQISSLAFHPSGTRLAAGSKTGEIILWDVATRQAIGQPLKAHTNEVTRVLFSPDGQTLASASRDTWAYLWDVAVAQPFVFASLRGHDAMVTSLAFNHQGDEVASADENNVIMLWAPGPVTPTTRFYTVPGNNMLSLAISPDQRLMALGSGDGNVRVLDTATGSLLTSMKTDAHCGHLNIPTPAYFPCYLDIITFSADGRRLIAAANTGNILIWDTRTWARLADPMLANVPCGSLLCNVGFVDGLVFSPRMDMVAVKGRGEIWIWDLHTRALKYHLSGHHAQRIRAAAFSPDGKLLASGGDDHTIVLWDLEHGQQSGTPLQGPTDDITMLAFPAQGDQLIASSYDNTIRSWNLQTHQETGRIANEIITTTGALAFSPDGRAFAGIAKDRVTVWDSRTLQPIAPPFLIPYVVATLAFTADSKRLASVSFSPVYNAAYVTLRTYRISDWRDQICQIVSRNLTIDEIRTYALTNVVSPHLCPSRPVQSSVIRDTLAQAQEAALQHNTSSASTAFAQATQWAVDSDDAPLNYFVCLDGSLNHFPREVLPACQHAIDLVPDDLLYVDGRGVARVLLGDDAGAREDFQRFVAWAIGENIVHENVPAMLAERQQWIAKLQAHDTTFLPQLLVTVRAEYKQESPECRSGHCPVA